jgi:hypothetical protein
MTIAGGCSVLVVGGRALWAFALCFALVFATWGLIAANATALALRSDAAVVGTAAALAGCIQYGMGAAVAPLAGLAGGGSTAALGTVVAALGVLGCLVAWRTARLEQQHGLRTDTDTAAATAIDLGLV